MQKRAILIAKLIQKKWPKNPKGYRLLGLVYQHQDKTKRALRLYKKAHQLSPNDKSHCLYLGNIYQANNQYTLAEKWYLRAAKYKDLQIFVYFNLTFLYQKIGDMAKATICAKKTLKLIRENKKREVFSVEQRKLIKTISIVGGPQNRRNNAG